MASTDVVNVSEYQLLAKQKLPKAAYDFYASGSDDQWTLLENIRAFQRFRLRPRILVDVSHVDTTTEVLGFKISSPIMVAPTSLHKMAHPEGELATARAASAASTIMVLSSSATTSMEDIAKTGPGLRFFQLYVYKNREATCQVIRRVEKAGFKAVVLTADAQWRGKREADIKNSFALPPHLTFSNYAGTIEGTRSSSTAIAKESASAYTQLLNFHLDQSLSWKDISWLRGVTRLPILIKGVLTGEDARLSVHHGAAGIIVSNHGGRQLNHAPPTIDVLEEVVEAVQGKIPVFIDGGIRRGTDVFKAMALGAAGVFVGRPVVFGLAVDGEAGVTKVLQMLKDEFESAMTLAGCCKVQDINREHIETLNDSFSRSKL
ncbi:unnamed protein product [Calypogeia fissa]